MIFQHPRPKAMSTSKYYMGGSYTEVMLATDAPVTNVRSFTLPPRTRSFTLHSRPRTFTLPDRG